MIQDSKKPNIFQYLTAPVENNGDNGKQIRCRLALGMKDINRMKKLWQGQDKTTKLKVLSVSSRSLRIHAKHGYSGEQTTIESQSSKTSALERFFVSHEYNIERTRIYVQRSVISTYSK